MTKRQREKEQTMVYKTLYGNSVLYSLIYSFWLPLWYLLTLDHCVVCSLIYSFWLPLWYLLTLDHCVVCSLIYSFWLLLWYLQSFLMQCNDQKTKGKRTNNGVQNTIQYTKEWATLTPQKHVCSGRRVSNSCSDLQFLITPLVSSNSRPLCSVFFDLQFLIVVLTYLQSRW
jgi:hypothetical protein